MGLLDNGKEGLEETMPYTEKKYSQLLLNIAMALFSLSPFLFRSLPLFCSTVCLCCFLFVNASLTNYRNSMKYFEIEINVDKTKLHLWSTCHQDSLRRT